MKTHERLPYAAFVVKDAESDYLKCFDIVGIRKEGEESSIADVLDQDDAWVLANHMNVTIALLARSKEVISTLHDYLTEAHKDDLDNGHHGDDPEDCTYCKALTEATNILALLG